MPITSKQRTPEIIYLFNHLHPLPKIIQAGSTVDDDLSNVARLFHPRPVIDGELTFAPTYQPPILKVTTHLVLKP
jgi:hypothetical protein